MAQEPSQLFEPVAEHLAEAVGELAGGAHHVADVLGTPVVAETLFAVGAVAAYYKYRSYRQSK